MDLRDRSKLRSAKSDDFIYEEELDRELIAMGMIHLLPVLQR